MNRTRKKGSCVLSLANEKKKKINWSRPYLATTGELEVQSTRLNARIIVKDGEEERGGGGVNVYGRRNGEAYSFFFFL